MKLSKPSLIRLLLSVFASSVIACAAYLWSRDLWVALFVFLGALALSMNVILGDVLLGRRLSRLVRRQGLGARPTVVRPQPQLHTSVGSTDAGAAARKPITKPALDQWKLSRQDASVPTPALDDKRLYRSSGLPFAHEIPVAIIADNFTWNSFEHEFDAHRLTPENWRDVFERVQPQLFFCESAWQGGDPDKHPWQAKIYASSRWNYENRQVLLEILAYCNAAGIPTVFWNKEDPTHFADRINDFVRTATLFDYVFTTAEECIPGYRKDAGVKNVDVLPFASQPKIFNPLSVTERSDSAVFAGTWYANYPERGEAAAKIMDLVIKSGRDLVIFDRMSASKAPQYAYPERFQPYCRAAIGFEETASAYRSSKFGITLNTVTDSRTMFARRAFELASCGTVVLSNYAAGVDHFFGESVIFADRDPQRFLELTPQDEAQLQRDALAVALDNTYSHRAESILAAVGIRYEPRYGRTTGLVTVNTNEEYLRALESYRQREQLEGMIAVVGTNAEQSLEFFIGARHDDGVVVVNERALKDREYRIRSFLGSRGIITAQPDGGWLPDVDLAYMASHETYTDRPVRLAETVESRFRTVEAPALSPSTFIPVRAFAASLAEESPELVSTVEV